MQVSSYKDDTDNKNDLNDEKTDDYVWLWEIDDRYYGCLHFFVCDVASFFVCLVFIEYVVFSVLIEHVQRFEPQVGCLQWDSAL